MQVWQFLAATFSRPLTDIQGIQGNFLFFKIIKKKNKNKVKVYNFFFFKIPRIPRILYMIHIFFSKKTT